MKVGLVTGEFPPLHGGVGDFSLELARALSRLGAEVHVLTRVPSRGLEVPGLQVHGVVRGWSFGALLGLRRLARQLGLDLLDLQYQAAAYDLSAPIHFLPQLAGLPVVVTFHDLRVPYLFPKAGRLRPAAVRALARGARGVIATDPSDAASLRAQGLPRVAHIPIGSNIAPQPPQAYARQAWRARLGVGPDEFLLGYFGFLNASKGGDTLIHALGALAEAPVRLLLIGGQAGSSDPSDARFGAEVQRLIARHGLEARVLSTGFVSAAEVSAHLLACDALALPYRDGVSFRRGSFMAALAHGCAVITTTPPAAGGRGAELPAGLVDGGNVRLVPPDDAPALALAVTQLRQDPELRARLGQAARALSAGFSWESIARQTLDFFHTCVAP